MNEHTCRPLFGIPRSTLNDVLLLTISYLTLVGRYSGIRKDGIVWFLKLCHAVQVCTLVLNTLTFILVTVLMEK